MSFGRWASRYFEFKSDARSGATLAGPFWKLNLNEIKPIALGELLDRVKTERGPGPAVHAGELVLQVFRFATGVFARASSSGPPGRKWTGNGHRWTGG